MSLPIFHLHVAAILDETALYQQRFDMALQGLKKLGEGYGARDEFRYDIAKG